MVVLFDPEYVQAQGKPLHHSLIATPITPAQEQRVAEGGDQGANPNINGFSAALSCYPIVKQLASQLDLNTLHDLSRTCRQFRANLLDFCRQLVHHTLRCHNEHGIASPDPGRLTSGRVATCARDMVADCQRCGIVVCRNCTIKPPPAPVLPARHRRLCRTCASAPLARHLARPRSPLPGDDADADALKADDHHALTPARSFTARAFERAPCVCASAVWLCVPCGKDLQRADTVYLRGWSWRNRYSHYLGGVGTGAGEGNEGVECGRGPTCLGARLVEHETCPPGTSPEAPGPNEPNSEPERWQGSSYLAQEMEGIGGVLKVKHKQQVRIGECVPLYQDERDKSTQFLEPEVEGRLRSWCSWCERVVLGDVDKTWPEHAVQ